LTKNVSERKKHIISDVLSMADRALKALVRELEQLRAAARWPRRPATTAPSALFVAQRMRSHKLPPPGTYKNIIEMKMLPV
jgi:hypothetical protein